MAKGKRRSSTGSDPFGSYREFTTGFSVDEGIADGLGLHSPPLNALEVNWPELLSGSDLNFPEVIRALQAQLDATRPSALGALLSITASHARLMRDMDAAPFPAEIAQQFVELRGALRRVGALAQGKKADEPIAAKPGWHTEAKFEVREEQEDQPYPIQPRSRNLHPVLQDQISLGLQNGRDRIANDFERHLFDAHLAKQEQTVLEFFDTLPDVLDWIQKGIKFADEHAAIVKRKRKKGAPADRAADWAMTRLLWIWRDVLGREINIYVRRISGKVELEDPEPNACVSFVLSVMERIDPRMLPVGAQNLERKLNELHKAVPAAPLVVNLSRKN